MHPFAAEALWKIEGPSPEVVRSIAPPASALLDAFVRHLGGDPRAYRGIVPPHFFPHWALPAVAETLTGISYPLLRVLNERVYDNGDGALRPVPLKVFVAASNEWPHAQEGGQELQALFDRFRAIRSAGK